MKAGKADSVGEAVDRAVAVARRLENRVALDRETARYFANLPPEIETEERDLGNALNAASLEVDFERP